MLFLSHCSWLIDSWASSVLVPPQQQPSAGQIAVCVGRECAFLPWSRQLSGCHEIFSRKTECLSFLSIHHSPILVAGSDFSSMVQEGRVCLDMQVHSSTPLGIFCLSCFVVVLVFIHHHLFFLSITTPDISRWSHWGCLQWNRHCVWTTGTFTFTSAALCVPSMTMLQCLQKITFDVCFTSLLSALLSFWSVFGWVTLSEQFLLFLVNFGLQFVVLVIMIAKLSPFFAVCTIVTHCVL